MNCFAFLIFSISLYLILVLKSTDYYHPNAIFILIWGIVVFITCVGIEYNVSALQREWSPKMWAVILLSTISFFSGSLITNKKSHPIKRQKIYFTKLYRIIFNFTSVITFLVFLIHFSTNNFIPTLLISVNVGDLKLIVPKAIPFLHYFEILIPYLVVLGLYELMYSEHLANIRKKYLIFYIFFGTIIYTIMYSLSRGQLIIIFLSFVYLWHRKHGLKIRTIFISCIIILLLFYYLFLLRVGKTSSVLTIFGGETFYQSILSMIYSYVAYNFENLRKLVESSFNETYFLYSLKFLLKPFLYNAYESNALNLIEHNTLMYNARTYLYGFFHDLKFFGVAFYPFIISLLVGHFYNKSIKNINYIIVILFLQKAIFFNSFANYFFGELVIFFPILFGLVMIYFNNNIFYKETLNSYKKRSNKS